MITHYATYAFDADDVATHVTRCGLGPDSEDQTLARVTRDPLLVTCVECKR